MRKILEHPKVQQHLPQILKFIVGGGCGAVLDLTSQWILVEHFQVPTLIGFVVSACVGASFVFCFNKYLTFRNHEQTVGNQFAKFAVVYVPSIGLNFFMSSFFYWVGVPHEIAKALAIGIGAVINYIMSTTFIFRKKKA